MWRHCCHSRMSQRRSKVPPVAQTPIRPTPDEIEAARSPFGGWTAATLASWGVPWPPPKGWRRALEQAAIAARRSGSEPKKRAKTAAPPDIKTTELRWVTDGAGARLQQMVMKYNGEHYADTWEDVPILRVHALPESGGESASACPIWAGLRSTLSRELQANNLPYSAETQGKGEI